MSQFDNATSSTGVTLDISYADLAGANAGQRPDLLTRTGAVYRTPDGKLFSELSGQLVRAAAIRPIILAQSAIPVILAPNGTVATNGTITLGTALPVVYANAWVRLPAGAVVGGAAGLYYATFSSTTVGVITTTFVDPNSMATPVTPVTTTIAVGSNAAYTQTINTDINLANVIVPGGWMGPNGALRFQVYATVNNTAGSKTLTGKFSGVYIQASAGGSSISSNLDCRIKNRGVSSQISHEVRGAIAGLAPIYSTINTAVDQAFTITALLATATDCMILEDFTVEVLPG